MGTSRFSDDMKRQDEKALGIPNGGLFPIVGIGASAGGLEALTQLLKHLPDDTGMALVVVQHLAPQHQSMLTELLSRATKVPVVEATEGKRVEPDHIYVIPPNTDMVISDGVLSLKPREIRAGPPLPIDCFLISLAEDRRNQAIGIILSGSASDGTLGLKAIKAEGGITFAQDEKSAKFSSMPHSAITAGYVDFVLPPAAIARELARIGRHPYLTAAAAAKTDDPPPAVSGQLDQVFHLLRSASGVDFGHYKQNTVMRRIKRRMVVHNVEDLADYVLLLHGNPAELQALYVDMLINVTSFFREPEAFEFLARKAFPQLTANHPATLRIWVPGCSTGEEAYSIAICALEFLSSAQSDIAIQLLATDISEKALEKARRGRYTETELSGVSPERLSRFFTKVDGDYQINKSIREVCVFARQNVIKDPPFSRLDLISCRNLLIYLEKSVQRRLIPVFHFALQPGGFLMLGRSESISEYSELFRLVDKKNRIYSKKPKPSAGHLDVDAGGISLESAERAAIPKGVVGEFDLQKQMDRLLLADYTPPCIVVNEDLEIVQFHGHTGAYLDPKPGAASLRLLKMARAGLPLELRTAIDQARKTEEPVIRTGVKVASHPSPPHSKVREADEEREITIEVRPFKAAPSGQRYFLVIFHEASQTAPAKTSTAGSPTESPDDVDLRRQLNQAKYELQDIIEQLENSNEQLRAANEEIQSNNEELQTTNEELETAKEELQASNEELTTLNEELQNRNSELTLTNNDLSNVISNITVPMVILGSDLHIRRFTASAKKILGLIPADVGRPLTDLRCAADFPDLDDLVGQAVKTMSIREQEVLNRQGRWYSLRVRPYQTVEDRIDGAVITLVDINDLKSQASESYAYAHAIVETVRELILVLDRDLRVKSANRSFFEHFRTSPQETEGRYLAELGNGQWDNPQLLKLLKEVLPEKELNDFELEHEFPVIGRRTMLLNARQITEGPESGTLILLGIRDITERNQARRLIDEQANLLTLAEDAIIVRKLDGTILSWNRGAEKIYGWSREQALGKNKYEFLNSPHDLVEEQRRSLLAEGRWKGELVHTTSTGATVVMSSRQVVQRSDGGDTLAVLEINRDITAQKKTLEQLAQERAAVGLLSGQLLRLQDEERRRIARELHDSTAQTLSALAINLGLLEGDEHVKATPKTRSIITDSQALAAQAADEIRNLSHLLHPPDLETAGLVAALRWLAQQISAHRKLTVDLDLPSEAMRWPGELELALFRVAQESLSNVQRHSGSKVAKIRLYPEGGEFVMEVEDKGHGMEAVPQQDDSGKTSVIGVGIAGMRERLRQLGGRLDVVSTSHGTTVRAIVPVNSLKIT